MKFKRHTEIEKGRLDMTPLIDVVFLLLIFFMLSSSFIFNPGIKVDLPESSASSDLRSTDLIITVTKENMIFFKDVSRPLNMTELDEKLKRAAAEDPDQLLIMNADSNVPYGKVVKIMSMAWDAGLRRQGLGTQPTL